jgi:hypothetical protein
MKNEFIPYEQALELKELGFDEPCFGRYDGRDENKGKIWYEMPNLGKGWIPVKDVLAPTFSQAFRWFREKHGLCSWITMELGNKSTFCWVLSGEHTSTQYAAYFHTYEEAELACLKKLIEIVNTKEK